LGIGAPQEPSVPNLRLARQALLRLLIALAAIVGAVQLFRLLLLPAIQSVFHPGDAVTSLLRRTGIFLCVVLAYWAYVRFIERRAVGELRFAPRSITLGAVSGSLLIAIAMLLMFALGAYDVGAYRGLQTGLLDVAGLIVIAAVLEEVGYRCILFRILENALGTVPAMWLQSLVFALMHIANIEGRASTQELITTVVAGTLIGAFWTLVFVHTRNLWAVAANHAAWNYTIILAGIPLSGIDSWRRLAPFASKCRDPACGPTWITGGVFGPEDSWITIALVAASLSGMLYWARRTQRLLAAGAIGTDSAATVRREFPHG
jgi:membrane protease YdiL (CAAX protease family)